MGLGCVLTNLLFTNNMLINIRRESDIVMHHLTDVMLDYISFMLFFFMSP